MKCKKCGFEAPVISRSPNPHDPEFIALVDDAVVTKCPRCGYIE